jgi:hypothetical protein
VKLGKSKFGRALKLPRRIASNSKRKEEKKAQRKVLRDITKRDLRRDSKYLYQNRRKEKPWFGWECYTIKTLPS